MQAMINAQSRCPHKSNNPARSAKRLCAGVKLSQRAEEREGARDGERDGEREASVDRHLSLCSAGVEHLIMECLSRSGHVLVYGYGETCSSIKAAA